MVQNLQDVDMLSQFTLNPHLTHLVVGGPVVSKALKLLESIVPSIYIVFAGKSEYGTTISLACCETQCERMQVGVSVSRVRGQWEGCSMRVRAAAT